MFWLTFILPTLQCKMLISNNMNNFIPMSVILSCRSSIINQCLNDLQLMQKILSNSSKSINSQVLKTTKKFKIFNDVSKKQKLLNLYENIMWYGLLPNRIIWWYRLRKKEFENFRKAQKYPEQKKKPYKRYEMILVG